MGIQDNKQQCEPCRRGIRRALHLSSILKIVKKNESEREGGGGGERGEDEEEEEDGEEERSYRVETIE